MQSRGRQKDGMDEILRTAEHSGREVEKIYLIDKNIEFCKNCRKCTEDDKEKIRGTCVIKDDMDGILSKVDRADAIIVGSPINFGCVTAITKRFVE